MMFSAPPINSRTPANTHQPLIVVVLAISPSLSSLTPFEAPLNLGGPTPRRHRCSEESGHRPATVFQSCGATRSRRRLAVAVISRVHDELPVQKQDDDRAEGGHDVTGPLPLVIHPQ